MSTTDKLTNILNSRTLRDVTHKHGPYKMKPSDSQIKTLTHISDCYDHTYKAMQSLNIDSQRITQSSKGIQASFENLNTLFNSSNSL